MVNYFILGCYLVNHICVFIVFIGSDSYLLIQKENCVFLGFVSVHV